MKATQTRLAVEDGKLSASRWPRDPLLCLLSLLILMGCQGGHQLSGADDDDDSGADDDDDSAEDLLSTALNAVSVATSDVSGDGIWSPGETLVITAELRNDGPLDHMYYPSFQLEASVPEVTILLNSLWTFYGMYVGNSMEGGWSVTAPSDATPPLQVTFTITGQNLHPDQPCGGGGLEPPCITSTPLVFSATIE